MAYNNRIEDGIPTAMAQCFATALGTTVGNFKKPGLYVLFKGNNYSVDLLCKQAGPLIEVNTTDICLKSANLFAHLVDEALIAEKQYNAVPVFAKYEGKYVVLLGSKTVEWDIARGNVPGIKGRLISNPALKRALVTG